MTDRREKNQEKKGGKRKRNRENEREKEKEKNKKGKRALSVDKAKRNELLVAFDIPSM